MEPAPEARGDDTMRTQAIQSLRRRQAFRFHRNVYLAVSGLLIAVWLAVGVGAGAWFPWPVFPIAGWGIGVFFHKQAVGGPSISEADIQREISRLKGES